MFYPSITPEFMAGICNGISQAVSGHPLDTIKVLQQNNKNWNTLKFKELMRGLQYPLTYNQHNRLFFLTNHAVIIYLTTLQTLQYRTTTVKILFYFCSD